MSEIYHGGSDESNFITVETFEYLTSSAALDKPWFTAGHTIFACNTTCSNISV